MPRKSKRTRTRSRVSSKGLILILLVFGAATFFLPIFPSITVTFRVVANSIAGDVPLVLTDAWNYQKLALTSSASIPKGQIIIVGYTNITTSSRYLLLVSVTYGSQTISPPGSIAIAGAGSYQLRVVYSPLNLNEQPNIPYSIHIAAATPQNQTYVGTIVNILPS